MSEITHDQEDKEASAKGESGSAEALCKCGSGASECGCRAVLSCEMRLHLECWVRTDSSSWRAPAFSSYAYLRDELQRLRPCPKVQQSVATGVERALDEALFAMTPPRRRSCGDGRRTRWRNPWSWLKRLYSGSDIEQAWRAIHRAQAALFVIYPRVELVPQAERVEAVIAELPEQTALLKSVTGLISQLAARPGSAASTPSTPSTPSPTPTAPGTMLRGIYERVMDVSDCLQLEARALRNALMTASAAIFLVLAAVGFAHLIEPGIIHLCASVQGHRACPISGSPHGFDVFAVELAGMLGGLLSVVIPLANGERIKTPYRIFNQQLVLKTLAGAATAVGGVLLLVSGMIDTIQVKTTTAILGYAVIFGFAQQIVTGAIDRRADSLAKQTPTAKSV